MTLDFSRCRLQPFAHQREDTARLVASPYFFIASEMRTGKTKIVIDGAQFLAEVGVVDRVLVVTPNAVRDVWFDPEIGELQKHLWQGMPTEVTQFHAPIKTWLWQSEEKPQTIKLRFLVTNYEYLLSKARLTQLLAFCGPTTLLVLDESSYVKNYRSQRTKAAFALRKRCGRVVELNGTPIYHSPMDLFSQANLLDPSILDCPYVTLYRARYAVTEGVRVAGGRALTDPRGRAIEKIVGWKNLDDVQRRLTPYVVRRLQAECLDLPPRLPPKVLTATLDPATWRTYRDMRDEMCTWLSSSTVASASTAAAKVLRLSQITSGFLGGIEAAGFDVDEGSVTLTSLDAGLNARARDNLKDYAEGGIMLAGSTKEVGREKLDALLAYLDEQFEAFPTLKLVVWCRFLPELARLLAEVAKRFPQVAVGRIAGNPTKTERKDALALLHPETAPRDAAVFVGGTFGTGAFGLNLSAASLSVCLSFDYSLGKYRQTAERVIGPDMLGPASYLDVVAVGPKGQKTIDHAIVAARRANEDVADWTTAAWVKKLREE